MYTYFKFDAEPSEKEIKTQWRKVAKTMHPDKGGCAEEFKKAFKEYEEIINRCGSGLKVENPSNYTSFDEFLASVSADTLQAYIEALKIKDIEIEVCGTWLWINLDKEQVEERTKLKEIDVNGQKFRFSPKKKTWYFGKATKRKGRGMSMEQIRASHGSNFVKRDEKKKIKV